MKFFQFISHRGDQTADIENTMSSFKKAVENGFSIIETDIQMSKDGKLFLYHDKGLERFGDDNVKDITKYTLDEILSFRLYDEKIDKYDIIPSLEEYLDWMTSFDSLYTNLEIKINKDDLEYKEDITKQTLVMLDKYPLLKDRVMISSFSKPVMQYLVGKDKYAKAMLYKTHSINKINENWKNDKNYLTHETLKLFYENNCVGISINANDLDVKRVKFLKNKFKQVFVFSILDDAMVKNFLKCGVDSIFIDYSHQNKF